MAREFDLRLAINGVSDVVENRPSPLREFDQIFMKVADMVIQAHYVSQRFEGRDVLFVGDGDAIALAIMHLMNEGIFEQGPSHISVIDFDERIVNSINRFSEKHGFADRITARLYNVADALPNELVSSHQAFYTNPPWGASNNGESVFAFLERGIEGCKPSSIGAIVVADDDSLQWTGDVLLASQRRAAEFGFAVAEMIPKMHSYHLDDSPELRSCTCLFRQIDPELSPQSSKPLESFRRQNFYGRSAPLKIRYVRDTSGLNYGRAPDSSYVLEPMEQ